MSYSHRPTRDLLRYESLESRQLLAVWVTLEAGNLRIQGDAGNNQVTVSQSLTHESVEVWVEGQTLHQFDSTQIHHVFFLGGNGDDLFVNSTDLPTDARGHAGNDSLTSGNGDDLLIGGPGADVISSTGGSNKLIGGPGDDHIHGGQGTDLVFGGQDNDTIRGGQGDDILYGDWGDDLLYGELGDDLILGYTGADTIYGQGGNDRLYGQADNDSVFGGTGDDIVRGGKHDDFLEGNDGHDYMMGDLGDDQMHGGLGVDVLYGYDGSDYLRGGGGNDRLYGQAGSDDLGGGEGDDLLRGGSDDDLLQGMEGNDRLGCDEGDDVAYGGPGDDVLLGNEGADHLDGQSGADLIYGHADNDLLRGGADNDILWGGNGADSLFGGKTDDMDRLWGEGDDDRFLVQPGDDVRDLTPLDAQLLFVNHSGDWSDKEIEVLDLGFAQLHERTQNTRLLKDPLPTGPLTFYKESLNYLGNALAVNSWQWTSNGWTTSYSRQIRFAEWSELSESQNRLRQSTVIHEIAHNWDSELELTRVNAGWSGRANSFQQLSHWTTIPHAGMPFIPSLDGQWWYLPTSADGFAREYGKTNPYEDLATVWEHYFSGQTALDPGLQSKLDYVHQLFDDLA
ncbi:MAG: hypothetical protein MK108_13620 [Mariniblastus sp.]|nr:hypothetical protein [Mariniblastus sp.]